MWLGGERWVEEVGGWRWSKVFDGSTLVSCCVIAHVLCR